MRGDHYHSLIVTFDLARKKGGKRVINAVTNVFIMMGFFKIFILVIL